MKKNFKILAISGSLRKLSTNTLFLKTMANFCPSNITFEIYNHLNKLPFFNPDDDIEGLNLIEVEKWRSALANADMIVLVSPEYAHGVTGVMKNALDWIVSSGELLDKPLAFPNISLRAEIAYSHLLEILDVMGCKLLKDCSPRSTLTTPYMLADATEKMILEDPEIIERIKALWKNIESNLSNF
ncbi:MAG: NADPH-dependent FMN reductase [Acinetobacter guillouiae]